VVVRRSDRETGKIEKPALWMRGEDEEREGSGMAAGV
jgi:hypothetical protein